MFGAELALRLLPSWPPNAAANQHQSGVWPWLAVAMAAQSLRWLLLRPVAPILAFKHFFLLTVPLLSGLGLSQDIQDQLRRSPAVQKVDMVSTSTEKPCVSFKQSPAQKVATISPKEKSEYLWVLQRFCLICLFFLSHLSPLVGTPSGIQNVQNQPLVKRNRDLKL